MRGGGAFCDNLSNVQVHEREEALAALQTELQLAKQAAAAAQAAEAAAQGLRP